MAQQQASENAQGFALDLPRRAFRRRKSLAPLPAGQPDRRELAARMRRFAMFAQLPEEVLDVLAEAASVRVYRIGEAIWHQGDPNCQVLFIEQGLAKTSRSPRGVSRTYGLYGPGDSMGIFAIWTGMQYPTDAIALSDGLTAIVINPATLAQLAESKPCLSGPLMTEIGHFAEAFIHKIDIVSAGTVPRRLATLMAMLIERYGMGQGDGSARLPINLTLEQISDIVDARVETVARVLGNWRRQGWLRIDSHGCHFSRLDAVHALLAD